MSPPTVRSPIEIRNVLSAIVGRRQEAQGRLAQVDRFQVQRLRLGAPAVRARVIRGGLPQQHLQRQVDGLPRQHRIVDAQPAVVRGVPDDA